MKTFAELDLIDPVQRALAHEKYEVPTPIQAQTIPPALAGRDVLGCAQTGTGKTAAFALPILNRLGARNRKSSPREPLALILAPTRELAIQIGDSFATYGRHLSLRQAVIFGGVGQGNQVRSLNRGAHLLIATPGRLLDLMGQGYIDLKQLEVFVLDEADRMLDMGFLPDLKRIISRLPAKRQSLFFSATMPPKIVELTEDLLRDPVSVNVTPESPSVDRIDQQVRFVDRSSKMTQLRDLLTEDAVERAVVFTRTKRGANMVAEKLERMGLPAAAIHGNKSQNARQRALEAFRRKLVRILVATDVAARGIDIDGISHVVNFDMPIEPESYVHRIGRTARAGASGVAISFCTVEERRELRDIERLIGRRITVVGDMPEPGHSESNSRPERSRSRRPSGGPSHGGRNGQQSRGKRKRPSSPRRKDGDPAASTRTAEPVVTEKTRPQRKRRNRRRPAQSGNRSSQSR